MKPMMLMSTALFDWRYALAIGLLLIATGVLGIPAYCWWRTRRQRPTGPDIGLDLIDTAVMNGPTVEARQLSGRHRARPLSVVYRHPEPHPARVVGPRRVCAVYQSTTAQPGGGSRA